MRGLNRALSFPFSCGLLTLFVLGCSGDDVAPPKDYPVGITGTWAGNLGDTALEVPFDCQGLCQNYFVGTFVGADSLAGSYYYWAPQPPLDGYPILSWHARRTSKQVRSR